MYRKRMTLLKALGGICLLLAGIIALLIINGKNKAFFQTKPAMHQERLKDSAFATAESGKDLLQTGHMSSEQGKDASKMSHMEQALSRLSRKMTGLESTVAELSEKQDTDTDSDINAYADREKNEIASETEEEEIMIQINAQIDIMEAQLQSEPVDAEWADSAIKELFSSVEENTHSRYAIRNADCRSTLCRVNLALNTEESFREFKEQLPWHGEGFYNVNLDSGEAVVYVARDGYSLPRLEE